jgi:dTDP-4-amino-4,6-dideoxy-D-galactose acyltransferase
MIERLSWDSDFFGKKIGKIIVEKDDLNFMDCFYDYDLIYIFSNKKLNISASLVDTKITFGKKIINKSHIDNIAIFDNSIHDYNQLLSLVYLSGKDSRFRMAPFFSEEDFKKLYKRWIDRSIEDNDTIVLIYLQQNLILGFVTFSCVETKAFIGLIAVSPNFQGQGVGSMLIQAVENSLANETFLTVPTQQINLGACNFYIKTGFEIINKQYIYHYVPNPL